MHGLTATTGALLLLAGCAFEADREHLFCAGPDECEDGQVCHFNLCTVRAAAPPPDAAPPLPDAAPPAPDAGLRLPGRPDIPDCPAEAHCLLPLRDTYTDEARPTEDLDGGDELRVTSLVGERQHTLLRFSLVDYHPIIGRVSDARVSLWVAQPPDAEGAELSARRLTEEWPRAVTWEDAPPPHEGWPVAESGPVTVRVGGRVGVGVTHAVNDALIRGLDHVSFRLEGIKGEPTSWVFRSDNAGGRSAPWLELKP